MLEGDGDEEQGWGNWKVSNCNLLNKNKPKSNIMEALKFVGHYQEPIMCPTFLTC